MKTMKLTLIALTALAASTVRAAFPENDHQVTASLEEQVLQEDQVADLFDPSRPAARPVSDLEFFAKLRTAPPPSNEGIPSTTNPPSPPDDLIRSAYSPAEMIAQALEDRKTLAIGQRIPFLEEQATRIIAISGDKPGETLLRLTLNRGVDVAHHLLPIAGNNSAAIARFLANFYREDFELAASMGNNQIDVNSRLTSTTGRTMADYLKHISIAEYGRIYASLLWRYSQELSSDSAKTVLLMRLLGYLGWDFNADLRRREHPIAQTIADIYVLQHSPLYSKLLAQLADGSEPEPDSLAQFRRKIYTILERLPSRLQQAGVYGNSLNTRNR